MTVLFKAFSALLSYPTEEMRAALPEIAEVVRTSPIALLHASATRCSP